MGYDGREIVHLYGNHYAVLDVALAWHRAGRPPINESWRSFDSQLRFRLAYENGAGAPADDPRQPNLYALGHTRGAALDIDATTSRVRALSAEGLVRPFPYESWHWAPANVYHYPIVKTLPADVRSLDEVLASLAGGDAIPLPITVPIVDEGDEHMRFLYTSDSGGSLWTLINSATGELVQTRDQGIANSWAEAWGSAKACSVQAFLNALHAVRLTTDPDDARFVSLAAAVARIEAEIAGAPADPEEPTPPKA